MMMLRERIGDPAILSLIGKWLKAGVMEGGVVVRTEQGTPQGGPISPILANIYLHYALDLWFEKRFKPTCAGEAYLTRWADDFAVCFQYRGDAERFGRQLRERHWPRRRHVFWCLVVLQKRDWAGGLRLPGFQACLRQGPTGTVRGDTHTKHQELPQVSPPGKGVACRARSLVKEGTTGTADGHASGLLSVF